MNTSQDDYDESEDHFHTSSPNNDKSKKNGRFVYFNDSNTSIVSNEPDNEEPDIDLASSKSYRRRSSVQIKAERKKADTQLNYSVNDISSIEADQINAYYQQRQKRHSWWNIFANEPRKYR